MVQTHPDTARLTLIHSRTGRDTSNSVKGKIITDTTMYRQDEVQWLEQRFT